MKKNFSFLMFYKKKLQKTLLIERQQWFLWVPVLYSIGILIYLTLPFEPQLMLGVFCTITLLFIATVFRKKALFFYMLLATFFIAAGFTGGNIRALQVKAPALATDV